MGMVEMSARIMLSIRSTTTSKMLYLPKQNQHSMPGGKILEGISDDSTLMFSMNFSITQTWRVCQLTSGLLLGFSEQISLFSSNILKTRAEHARALL
jgi:hypothetical protein